MTNSAEAPLKKESSTSIFRLNIFYYKVTISVYKLINYQDDGFYPIYDEQLKFNDTIHDVYGYITTYYNEKDSQYISHSTTFNK